ncbi:MAG: ferritin-like domain-containing protein [Thermoleophilia bacterium]|nr:ferritin-like domain-containing protein [Thermoleophilia bacterium]
MSEYNNLQLDEIDPSGAITESLEAAQDVTAGQTRADFLKKFAVGASGIAIAGALASPAGALAQNVSGTNSTKQDIAILNYALTLEYLEQAFYVQAVNAKKLNSRNAYFAKVVASHETAHVKALLATIPKLGGKPVGKPKFNFRGTNGNDKTFLATSLALEETGVAAYLGQVTRIYNDAVLKAAGSIVTIEARHAAWVRTILGLNPAPKAFDGSRTINGTLAIVKGTKFIVG